MRRGTTPTLIVKTSQSLADFALVVLTVKSKTAQLDFENDRLVFTDEGMELTMTQEETLQLKGACEVQVRAVTSEGYAAASSIASAQFDRILKDGEISASGD